MSKDSFQIHSKTLPITRTTSSTSGTNTPALMTVSVLRPPKTLGSASRKRCAIGVSGLVTCTACGAVKKRSSSTSARCVSSKTASPTNPSARYSLPAFCAKSRKTKFNIKLICLSKIKLAKMSYSKHDASGSAGTISTRSLGP